MFSKEANKGIGANILVNIKSDKKYIVNSYPVYLGGHSSDGFA